MESNPYNLKVLDEKPSGYLSADELVDFLKKHKIPVKRMDNLPRFAHLNNIDMKKIVRDGSGGSVPTIYKIPNSTQFYVKTVLSKNDGTNTSGFKDIIKVNNRYTNDINQRFYQKDYVFFDVSNNDTGGSIYQDDGFDLLYTKDNSDNIWSKLNFSVIDPSFSIYKFNTQKFDTFLPLDISHSLIYKSV